MDEKQLTIKQVREVLDCSYPTALRFAAEYGTKVTIEETNQVKWFIPVSALETRASRLEDEAAEIRNQIAIVCNGANS